MKHTTVPAAIIQERTKNWLESDFYRSAIVLGLDNSSADTELGIKVCMPLLVLLAFQLDG